MKPDNLINFRINNPEAYKTLVKNYDCKIIYKGQTIYEGKYDKNVGFKLEEPEKCSVIFSLNEGVNFYFTLAENKALNKFYEYFSEVGSLEDFSEAMKNHKIYNGILNIAGELPVLSETNILFENKSELYNKVATLFESLLLEADEDEGNEDENSENESSEDGEDEEESIPGDGLPNEDEEKKKKSLERKAEIKFTIWESPNKKLDWLENNTGYQKIEYVYTDKNKGMNIDFLLGFDKGSWNLYAGKLGAVSYDDDPIFDTHENNFAKALIMALDEVDKLITAAEETPEEYPQFFINI